VGLVDLGPVPVQMGNRIVGGEVTVTLVKAGGEGRAMRVVVTLPLNVSLDVGFERWRTIQRDMDKCTWTLDSHVTRQSQGTMTLGHGTMVARYKQRKGESP